MLGQLALLLLFSSPAGAAGCRNAAALGEAAEGELLARAGAYAAAAPFFERAAALDRKCLDHRAALAACLERTGRPAEAARTLERAWKELGLRVDEPELYQELNRAKKELEKAAAGSQPSPGPGEAPEPDRAGKTLCASGRRGFEASEKVFDFIQISDPHVGEWMHGGSDDTRHLAWMADVGFPALKPAFMVGTGDLADGTHGFIIPMFGPYQKEWDRYAALVSGLPAGAYHDMPGNHDHYGDKHFDFYRRSSVSKALQHSWTVEKDGKLYQFLAVNTAGDDGGRWPGDEAGLRDAELDWLEKELRPDAWRVVVFGHHPPHRLKYGLERFKALLSGAGAVYFSGHSHKYYLKYEGGLFEVNLDSLGKDERNNYALATFLRDGDLCVRLLDAGTLP